MSSSTKEKGEESETSGERNTLHREMRRADVCQLDICPATTNGSFRYYLSVNNSYFGTPPH